MMKMNMKTLEIEPLKFNLESENIKAFTLLRGMVDVSDLYSAVNVCDYTGDDPSHVAECRQALCDMMKIQPGRLVMPRQTHTARVAVIDARFWHLDEDGRTAFLQSVDALVTGENDLIIGVNTADCVPLAFCDAAAGIVGVAHAGWKGTVSRIALNTVVEMTRLGASAGNIQVAIGASICPRCFEVGDEVVEQFAAAGFAMEQVLSRNAVSGKAHIDLWEANRQTLLASGIRAENIAVSGNCTRCHPDRYFSARRIGIRSGRTFTFIRKTEGK